MRLGALGALAAVVLLIPGLAVAQSRSGPRAGPYFDLRAGGSYLSDADNVGPGLTSGIMIESEFDLGPAIEGAFGWEHESGFRGEVALGYQQYDVDTLTFTQDGGIGNFFGVGDLDGRSLKGEGDVSVFTFMVNGYYALNLDNFRPYVGVGVGGADVSADVSALRFNLVDHQDTVFAYQGIVGLEYRLSDSVALGGRYTYFATTDPTFIDTLGFEFDSEIQAHSIMATIRISPGPAAPQRQSGPREGQSGPREGLYLDLRGGATYLENTSVVGPGTFSAFLLEAEFGDGYAFEAALGQAYANNFRAEIELGYRSSRISSNIIINDGGSGLLNGIVVPITDGRADAYSVMLNGYYDFDYGNLFTPFIGVGAGGTLIDVDSTTFGINLINDSDLVYAYQGIIGVSYDSSLGVSFNLSYNYFRTTNPRFRDSTGVEIESRYRSHGVMLGMRMAL